MDWYLEKVPSGEKTPLNIGMSSIGRVVSSTLILKSTFCSRNHCNIEITPEGNAKVKDFSSNGTYVNGECYGNMDEKVNEGDKIGIGCWTFDDNNPENMPIYILRRNRPEPSASNVIEISDDDDDCIDLGKYVAANAFEEPSTSDLLMHNNAVQENGFGQSVTGPLVALSSISDQNPQPSFLPSSSSTNPPFNGQFSSSSVAIRQPSFLSSTSSNISFLPSTSTADQLQTVGLNNENEQNTFQSGGISFLPTSVPDKCVAAQQPVAGPSNFNRQQSIPQFLKPSTPLPTSSTPFKDTPLIAEPAACEEISDPPSPIEPMDIDIPLSQSTLQDIKQEVADLECEQSLELQPSEALLTALDEHYLSERVESIHLNEGINQPHEFPRSSSPPIFIIDDDDEDDFDDVASAWAEKLSQSFNARKPIVEIPDIKPNVGDDPKKQSVTKADEIHEKMNRRRSSEFHEEERERSKKDDKKADRDSSSDRSRRQSRSHLRSHSKSEQKRTSSSSSSDKKRAKNRTKESKKDAKEKEHRLTRSSSDFDETVKEAKNEEVRRPEKRKLEREEPVPSTSRRDEEKFHSHLELKRRKPVVIEAPSLPFRRGRSKGHTVTPSTSVRQETERKLTALRLKDRMTDQEKSLKEKWRQRPSLERIAEKRRRESIKEERKVKLKELADQKAVKRKFEIDEQKVLGKPKVKVTEKNRSTLLAEGFDYEISKRAVLSKKIPKLDSRESKTVTMSAESAVRGVDERQTRSITARRSSIACASFDDKSVASTSKESESTRKRGISTRRASTVDKPDKRERRTSTPKSFEDALIDIEVKNKRRISSTSSRDSDQKSTELPKQKAERRATVDLRSILKPIEQNRKKKKKRRVRFNDKPEVRYFDVEMQENARKVDDCKDLPMNAFILEKMQKQIIKKSVQWVDHSDTLLGEILGWNPRWLDTRKAVVSGPQYALMPMMQQYESFEAFARMVLPLFKIELWHSIEQDFRQRPNVGFNVFRLNQFTIEKRGKLQRYVCQCEANIKSIKNKTDFTSQELCLVKLGNGPESTQMFGFITSCRSTTQNSSNELLSIAIECKANQSYRQIFEKAVNVSVKPISNIRVEIGIYNAVNYLQYSPLCKCILNPFELAQNENVPMKKYRYVGYNELNENQQSILMNAYQKCINSEKPNNLMLIEGPPGTGKSRTITNLALQIFYGSEMRHKKNKILICAQSNAAVDIIALKLLEIRGKMERDRFNLVRFGVLERMHPSIRCVSTQFLVASNQRNAQSEANLRALKQARKLLEMQIVALSANAGPDNVLGNELEKTKERLDLVNRKLSPNIQTAGFENHYPAYLNGANIVCTTLSSCIKLLNYVKNFDVCIVDEATQCAEPYTLIPLQFGISSLILVGDTQQLPATVLSTICSEYGFGTSLFTRLQKCLDSVKNNPIQMLKTQYRMHPEICQWPNSYFYKTMLINHESTNPTKTLIKPYAVLNLDYTQSIEREKGKLCNDAEAKFVVELISKLSKIISTEYFSYGIITPYTQQRDHLQKKIEETGIKHVLVNTIDSYQGREKDVIIFSSVRTKGVGFLGNCQRLNVALTRAKKCLLICGNFSSLAREPVWKSLLENAKRRKVFYDIKESDVADFDNKVMCHLKNTIE